MTGTAVPDPLSTGAGRDHMANSRYVAATSPLPTPRKDALRVTELTPKLTGAYLRVIEERYGLRLLAHQVTRLQEVIQVLLTTTGYPGPDALLSALDNEQPALLDTLAAALTVGETYFFRVEPQMEALRQVVLPDLLQRCAAQRRVRIWSAGCSTGEEAYTLAILLQEVLPAPHNWDIQIVATDVNRPSLEIARHGYYGEWSFRGTPDEVRRRYFVPEGKGWRLQEQIRRGVRFAYLNLVSDAFPSVADTAFDLVLCRNVTIYFSPAATQRVYRRFADILAPRGWLVLGPSDPTPLSLDAGAGPRTDAPFEAVSRPGTILWRRGTTSPLARGAATAPRALPTQDPAPRHAPLPAAPRPAPAPRRHAPVQGTDATTELTTIWQLVQAGSRAAALERSLRLARSLPLEPHAHLLLGMLYLDEGRLDPAVESLRRAMFLDKDNAMAHFSLGRAYQQQGQQARAQGAFTQARRLLAARDADQELAHSGGLRAGELRQTVDAQLAALRAPSVPTPERQER
jgi:chemotaxis protein methyltransferase CheR